MDRNVRVIIVEDDRDLRETLVEYLSLKGFDACGVGSCLEFYRSLAGPPFAVAVIDLGLPDQSGFVLAEYIRRNTEMGVVIVTARDALHDRLQGYQSGADLYLAKPVDCRELSAAIRNLARRLSKRSLSAPRELPPGSWRVARESWQLVTPSGVPIRLTAREMQFITSLAGTPDQPVNRSALLALLGYPDDEYTKRAMDSLVRRLRRKIEAVSGHPSPIKTIHGFGYSFTASVTVV